MTFQEKYHFTANFRYKTSQSSKIKYNLQLNLKCSLKCSVPLLAEADWYLSVISLFHPSSPALPPPTLQIFLPEGCGVLDRQEERAQTSLTSWRCCWSSLNTHALCFRGIQGLMRECVQVLRKALRRTASSLMCTTHCDLV